MDRRIPSALKVLGPAGPKNVNVPLSAGATRRQRKQTGRKKSTAAVTGAGGQNRSVAVGKRAAPTTPSTTRKALTRGQSRRRERVAERTVAQKQRSARRSARRSDNEAKRLDNEAKRAARKTARLRGLKRFAPRTR